MVSSRRLISSTIRIIWRAVTLAGFSSEAKLNSESGCPSWPTWQNGHRTPRAPVMFRICPTTCITGVPFGMTCTLMRESGGNLPVTCAPAAPCQAREMNVTAVRNRRIGAPVVEGERLPFAAPKLFSGR